MKTLSDQNHHPSLVMLFAAATIVLLILAWSYVY
jgi:hypothetical protein